jgi:hypothetical protein
MNVSIGGQILYYDLESSIRPADKQALQSKALLATLHLVFAPSPPDIEGPIELRIAFPSPRPLAVTAEMNGDGSIEPRAFELTRASDGTFFVQISQPLPRRAEIALSMKAVRLVRPSAEELPYVR